MTYALPVIDVMVAWVQKNYDMSQTSVSRFIDRALQQPPTLQGASEDKKLEWIRWMPSGVLQQWQNFTEREKALMISVAHHVHSQNQPSKYEND